MAIRKRGNSWQVDVTLNGERHRETFHTEAEAKAWELEARAAALQGRPIPRPAKAARNLDDASRRPRRASGGTLRDALEDAYDRFWKGGRSDAKVRVNMKQVEDYFGADRPIEEIDYSAIEAFIQHCISKRNSNGTVNRKLAVLSKTLRYAAKRGLIEAVPAITRMPEKGSRFRWLSQEEEQELLETLRRLGKDEQAECVAVLIDTGMRPSELFRLKPDDVDMARGTITIWVNKTDRPRTVYMTKRVKAIVEPRLAKGGKLFPYDTAWLYRAWKDAKIILGKGNDVHFVPYICRHTCASRLVQAGVHLNIVKEWLGHTTIQTTMRYAFLAPENLKSAVDALDR